jgi:gluconate 2-dehydrogenase alpha chain
VRYLDLSAGPEAGDPPVREVRSSVVVLAGGAFETPRLLLRDDLGNTSDQVGRNLMVHFQTLTVGAFPFRVFGASRGRSVTHVHDDHIVGDAAQDAAARDAGLPWVRGGLVEHGGAAGPVQEALIYGPGAHHPEAMRDSSLRERLWVFTMQGEDLARPENRVDLDPTIRDAWGGPAGRMTWSPHRHELVASAHAGPILEAVLREAGAEWTVTSTSPPVGGDVSGHPMGLAPASRHVVGTARMGSSPEDSVVDPECRLWDCENVVVCDSSVFCTSTGYGPTLTLVALAARTARLLVGDPLSAAGPGSGHR